MSGEQVKREAYSLISAFYRKFGIKPNAVYLGYKEYHDLLDSELPLGFFDTESKILFGLDIIRTVEEQHLSVGLSI